MRAFKKLPGFSPGETGVTSPADGIRVGGDGERWHDAGEIEEKIMRDHPPVEDIPSIFSNLGIEDGAFTLSELREAKKQVSFGKAPGEDGLSVEFYLKFWSSYNLIHDQHELP